jgi:hypothetical protein
MTANLIQDPILQEALYTNYLIQSSPTNPASYDAPPLPSMMEEVPPDSPPPPTYNPQSYHLCSVLDCSHHTTPIPSHPVSVPMPAARVSVKALLADSDPDSGDAPIPQDVIVTASLLVQYMDSNVADFALRI